MSLTCGASLPRGMCGGAATSLAVLPACVPVAGAAGFARVIPGKSSDSRLLSKFSE
jgi:hypothetical protein